MGSQCLHRRWQQQNPKRWRRWPLQTTNDASAALQTLRRSRRLKINNLLRTRTNRLTRSGADEDGVHISTMWLPIPRVRSFSLSGSDFIGAVFSGGKAE